ncbi:MAG: hypothetical protein ACD_22C00088G0004 [uncultured bacterium]|nr:MAG: hypothetical protein ACD_22C00088G0004 [uncultured bacterium]
MAEDKKIKKITVNRNACIGAATCVVVSPSGFELDSQNIAVVKPDATSLSDEELLMAAQSCPVAAIVLYDEEGNQIFPRR